MMYKRSFQIRRMETGRLSRWYGHTRRNFPSFNSFLVNQRTGVLYAGTTFFPRIIVSSAYSRNYRNGWFLVAHVCWSPFRGLYRCWLIG